MGGLGSDPQDPHEDDAVEHVWSQYAYRKVGGGDGKNPSSWASLLGACSSKQQEGRSCPLTSTWYMSILVPTVTLRCAHTSHTDIHIHHTLVLLALKYPFRAKNISLDNLSFYVFASLFIIFFSEFGNEKNGITM